MIMKNVKVNFADAIVDAIRDKNVDFDRRVNLWATVMCQANKAYNEHDKNKRNIGGKYDYSMGYILLCELNDECEDAVPGMALLNALDTWTDGEDEAKAVDEMCKSFFDEVGLFETTRIFEYNKEETNNGQQ